MKKIVLLLAIIILSFSVVACGGEEPQTEVATYEVSFDSDGGTEVDSQEVEEGAKAKKPKNPQKEGCEFLGWYLKNKKFDFKTPIESDITLTAKWETIEYEVRFSTDGGTRLSPVTVNGGDTLTQPEDPEKEGYLFLGWYLNDEEYDFSEPVLEDITLTAKWEEIVPEDDEIFNKMQTVLLLGQSNMVGIGDVLTVDPISDDRIFMLREDAWQRMREPLHTNAAKAGVGIGGSFAKAFVETFDCKLGLVPAAEGASTLADWAVGGRLYEEAVRLAKIAQRDSEICAILWHQGEGNQTTKDYAAQLKVIFDAMIDELDLDADKLVIITGELYGTRGDAVHTQQLVQLGNNYENYGIASSEGLTTVDVDTHFDAPSLRVFGYRYFDIFYNCITGKNYEFDDNPETYRTAPDKDNGEIVHFDFEDMNLGTVYNGLCGNGKVTVRPQNGSITIQQTSSSEKYLMMINGYDESTKKYTSTYIEAQNEIDPSSVVVLEAKFKLSAGSGSGASLLMALAESSTSVFQNITMAENGDIYAMSSDNVKGSKIGKISTDSWTSIRVVMDLENNVKDIYVNDEVVVRAAKISKTSTKDVKLVVTRLLQFVPGNDTGSVMIDDYRCYLFADNIAPGK